MMLSGMLRKAEQNGLSIYTKDRSRILTVKDAEEHFVVEPTSNVKLSLKFDYVVWTRGIFKILLA